MYFWNYRLCDVRMMGGCPKAYVGIFYMLHVVFNFLLLCRALTLGHSNIQLQCV